MAPTLNGYEQPKREIVVLRIAGPARVGAHRAAIDEELQSIDAAHRKREVGPGIQRNGSARDPGRIAGRKDVDEGLISSLHSQECPGVAPILRSRNIHEGAVGFPEHPGGEGEVSGRAGTTGPSRCCR